jgi:hypothetical protein
MNLIFLTFANDASEPLPTLVKEEQKVYELVARRYDKGDFDVQKESHATTEILSRDLIRYKDRLSVFQFSGHAGRDKLLMEDEEGNAEGVAQLLAQCNNLQLVILNGCSTQGQVARLLELPSRPAVIATSAPVGDMAAANFATAFYHVLCDQYGTVEEAFTAGCAAAQLTAEYTIEVEEQERGVAFRSRKTEGPLWGLFTAEDKEEAKYWALPVKGQQEAEVEAFEPNELLKHGLVESLAPYKKHVRKIKETLEETFEPDRSLDRKVRTAVSTSFPYPISTHIRSLISKSGRNDEGRKLFDKLGIDRLTKLTLAYVSIIELPAFILLAQLWDVLTEQKGVKITGTPYEDIREFLLLPSGEKMTDKYFELVQKTGKLLEENNVPFFVTELQEALPKFQKYTRFYDSCMTLELIRGRLRKNGYREESAIHKACMIAEEKITEILRELAFLSRYFMFSVRNIDAIRNRFESIPRFDHRLIRLEEDYSIEAPDEEMIKLRKRFLDNRSVLLTRDNIDEETEDDEEGLTYLNLTPFVIDENAFKRKGGDFNHKVFYFDHYDKDKEEMVFKFIYKSEEKQIPAKKPSELMLVARQVDRFSRLLLGKPLQEL